MFANVKEPFNLINVFVFVAVFNLLNASILTDGDRAYAIGLNLTNTNQASHEIAAISNYSSLQSYVKATVTDKKESFLLEKLFDIRPVSSDYFSLDDVYVSTNSRILLVDNSGVFRLNYKAIEDTQYASFVPTENNILSPATSVSDRAHRYKFTEMSFKSSDVAVLESDIPTNLSSRSSNSVKLDQFSFDPFGGLLILGCLFLSKRYLKKLIKHH